MTDLGTLGGNTSVAYGINDSGHVVGYSLTAGYASRAFLYDADGMTDLNTLIPPGSGWTLLQAADINELGQIVGHGMIGGQKHACLLKPDSDGDGVADDEDSCPNDPEKTEPGICGCGVPETDTDGDATPDCIDGCDHDARKIEPGVCGCGVPDDDVDDDGIFGCVDNCPEHANADQADCNSNGIGDVCEIAAGTSTDCNTDGLPDECDVVESLDQEAVPPGGGYTGTHVGYHPFGYEQEAGQTFTAGRAGTLTMWPCTCVRAPIRSRPESS
jgi:probable HAF family extracellular repeat protein